MSTRLASKRQLSVIPETELRALWRDTAVAAVAVGNPSREAIGVADQITSAYAAMCEGLAEEQGKLLPK